MSPASIALLLVLAAGGVKIPTDDDDGAAATKLQRPNADASDLAAKNRLIASVGPKSNRTTRIDTCGDTNVNVGTDTSKRGSIRPKDVYVGKLEVVNTGSCAAASKPKRSY